MLLLFTSVQAGSRWSRLKAALDFFDCSVCPECWVWAVEGYDWNMRLPYMCGHTHAFITMTYWLLLSKDSLIESLYAFLLSLITGFPSHSSGSNLRLEQLRVLFPLLYKYKKKIHKGHIFIRYKEYDDKPILTVTWSWCWMCCNAVSHLQRTDSQQS